MKINFKFTDTEVDNTLREYAETKVHAFKKLLGKHDISGAVCDVEFRRSTKHQTGDVCTAEVNLEVDGKLFRVSKDEPTFEKAIDKVKDDIIHSLRADKEKRESLAKQGGRILKNMFRKN
jgi:ribosomal subunit interface protein